MLKWTSAVATIESVPTDIVAVLASVGSIIGGVVVAVVKSRPQNKQASAQSDVLITEAAGQIIGFQRDYIESLRKDVARTSRQVVKLTKELDAATKRIAALETENRDLRLLINGKPIAQTDK